MRQRPPTGAACPTSETIAKLAQHFPFPPYAKELARLAGVVEEHSRAGRVSLETLSQLAAMQEIIGLIRSAGLAMLATSASVVDENKPEVENRVGYL